MKIGKKKKKSMIPLDIHSTAEEYLLKILLVFQRVPSMEINLNNLKSLD